jgi:hypothetical protein
MYINDTTNFVSQRDLAQALNAWVATMTAASIEGRACVPLLGHCHAEQAVQTIRMPFRNRRPQV